MVTRREVIEYLNSLFDIHNFNDSSLNGLQIEGADTITGFCLGVDSCNDIIENAISANLNFIITHHGFFWGHQFPITGIWKNRIKKLLNNDISLYACHLPMDANNLHGHNSEIAAKLQLQNLQPFGHYKNIPIGFKGSFSKTVPINQIEILVNKTLNTTCKLLNFGENEINTIGIVSGGGASESILQEAIDQNIDLFITGETEHSVFHLIKEMKLNVVFAGHYETEKFALIKLEKLLQHKFNIPSKFFYIPTEM